MIFITLGTTNFPFDRLLSAIDKAIIGLKSKEKIVIQVKKRNYKFKYQKIEYIPELAFSELICYIKKSRLVIVHGGPGSIYLSMKYAKNKPLIVPRLKKYNEHVNNHQLYFTNFLKDKNVDAIFPNSDNLMENLKIEFLKAKKRDIQINKIATNSCLVNNLIKYTNKIYSENI